MNGCARRPRSVRIARSFAFVLAVLALCTVAPSADAHPLGNFTVNSFSGLSVEPSAVAIRIVVDSAEIPTVQQFPQVNSKDGIAAERADEYASAECSRMQPGIDLTVGGASVPVAVRSSRLTVRPGQGGLHTMRLICDLRTDGTVDTVDQRLQYVDTNSLNRTGWREIIAIGNGVDLADSDVPAISASSQLNKYPQDLLTSPLDQRGATARVVAGDGTVAQTSQTPSGASSQAASGDWSVQAFTRLVSTRDLGIGFALVAVLIAIGLGAAHAFAPGHGKTLMAAYMLGQRSSLREVAVIGLTVTLTHTLGVLVLGVVLSGFALTAPARIYGWLGVASGILLLGIGVSLLRQARRRTTRVGPEQHLAELVDAGSSLRLAEHGADPRHGHGHGHGHGHEHEPVTTHAHGWGGSHTHVPPTTSARGMIAVGFAGGMVPSPSALVVLLGGIALGRAWFGVLLVVGYGIGMAVALIGVGLALSRARDHLRRWAERRRTGTSSRLLRATQALPTVTAVLVIVVGLGLALRSLATL